MRLDPDHVIRRRDTGSRQFVEIVPFEKGQRRLVIDDVEDRHLRPVRAGRGEGATQLSKETAFEVGIEPVPP